MLGARPSREAIIPMMVMVPPEEFSVPRLGCGIGPHSAPATTIELYHGKISASRGRGGETKRQYADCKSQFLHRSAPLNSNPHGSIVRNSMLKQARVRLTLGCASTTAGFSWGSSHSGNRRTPGKAACASRGGDSLRMSRGGCEYLGGRKNRLLSCAGGDAENGEG